MKLHDMSLSFLAQVTGQEDGARLLLSLEGKQSSALDSALKRLLELLPKEVVLAVVNDVNSLGQQQNSSSGSGSRRGSFQLIRAASPAIPVAVGSSSSKGAAAAANGVAAVAGAAGGAVAAAKGSVDG